MQRSLVWWMVLGLGVSSACTGGDDDGGSGGSSGAGAAAGNTAGRGGGGGATAGRHAAGAGAGGGSGQAGESASAGRAGQAGDPGHGDAGGAGDPSGGASGSASGGRGGSSAGHAGDSAGHGGEDGGEGGSDGGSAGSSAGNSSTGGESGNGCVDADGDGYGVGASCAPTALDCDDTDANTHASAREICSVTPSAQGCFESLRRCEGGIWGACQPIHGELILGGEACNGEDEDCDGEIDEALGEWECGIGACTTQVAACATSRRAACVPRGPASTTDGCNAVDDDCDGAVDEDCPECLHVAPDGDDATATAANGALPFRNVPAALAYAASQSQAPRRVCVAAGAACGASAEYSGPPAADLALPNGVSLYGNYESTGWTRCSNSATTLVPSTGRGIVFPSSVNSPTILDGFRVTRFAAPTTAGVTVDGGTFVLLSNLVITNAPSASQSYGVNVVNGGSVTVFRSRISGGAGSVVSAGIRAVGAAVRVADNCLSPDGVTGRCDDTCATGPAIEAGTTASSGSAYGVLLDDSPGSRIERSAVCANSVGRDVFGIGVTGDATGVVVRANAISASASNNANARGISFSACGGAAPRVVDNQFVQASTPAAGGSARLDGIYAGGDCHPVIEANAQIAVIANSQPSAVNSAVRCDAASGIASRCVLESNLDILGASDRPPGSGSPAGPWTDGVACLTGGCAKISRNSITGRKSHPLESGICINTCSFKANALELQGSPAFVDSNTLTGGCAAEAHGIYSVDSTSRIQNNRATGRSDAACRSGSMPRAVAATGITLVHSAAGAEADVHSNYVTGGTTADASQLCSSNSAGVVFAAGASPPTGPLGIFRNNYVTTFDCFNGISPVVREAAASADPRHFEHNYLYPGAASGVYLDDTGLLASIAQVNALGDMAVAGNLSSGSLTAAGITLGAPLWDFDGAPRGTPPSIGNRE